MVDGRNHTDGLGGVEAAQEAGETPTTPVILHPLSPITEHHHLLAVNNIHDKVSRWIYIGQQNFDLGYSIRRYINLKCIPVSDILSKFVFLNINRLIHLL